MREDTVVQLRQAGAGRSIGGWSQAHAARCRTSVSRVRQNRTHGLRREQGAAAMVGLVRHRQTKAAATDGPNLAQLPWSISRFWRFCREFGGLGWDKSDEINGSGFRSLFVVDNILSLSG